jgi:hypothetical protein
LRQAEQKPTIAEVLTRSGRDFREAFSPQSLDLKLIARDAQVVFAKWQSMKTRGSPPRRRQ